MAPFRGLIPDLPSTGYATRRRFAHFGLFFAITEPAVTLLSILALVKIESTFPATQPSFQQHRMTILTLSGAAMFTAWPIATTFLLSPRGVRPSFRQVGFVYAACNVGVWMRTELTGLVLGRLMD